MSKRKIVILAGLLLPLLIYMLTTFWYSFDGYDGEHCAGLLDAVWKCTRFEYYLDWLLSPFSMPVLFFYYFVSAFVTPMLLWWLKKYNKRL